jgi:hypothetical protein
MGSGMGKVSDVMQQSFDERCRENEIISPKPTSNGFEMIAEPLIYSDDDHVALNKATQEPWYVSSATFTLVLNAE